MILNLPDNPRILIVDDDPSSILIIKKAVSDLGEVFSTSEASYAVTLIKEVKPHVILLDIDMGEYNGVDICRMLKSDPDTAHYIIIFITASRDPDIEFKSLTEGGADYIPKPLDLRTCRMRVYNQLAMLAYQQNLERTSQALYQEKQRLAVTLNSIGDAVIATDTQAVITYMNPIAERLSGYAAGYAVGKHIEEILDLRDASSQSRSLNPAVMALEEKRNVAMALNCQLHSREGQIYRVEDSAAPIRDEDNTIIGAIMVFHDVSESVAMAVKMNFLANNDQLTGLPNRILLHDRLQHAITCSEASDTYTALLLIDLDHFKYINDALGHFLGDELIKKVAKRLESVIDPNATLARVGGDEFVLVLEEVRSVNYVAVVASNLIASFKEPFMLEQKEYQISVSIGVSMTELDANEEEVMMRHADVAMYRAKNQGRNTVCFFSQELEAELMKRHELEQLLRDALEKDNLIVLFQPQVEIVSGKICGFEALVRLKDDSGGLVSPLEFIPLAEEIGLIDTLGHQVLQKSCEFASQLVTLSGDLKVSVNVSAQQVRDEQFIEHVVECLEASLVQSRMLELEVTESALIEDFEQTRRTLLALSNMGVSIAIDDFGTGYSSLSYLKSLPLDVLKIDRAFIMDMSTDEQSLGIVQTIVLLAQALGLKLVAEGVETHSQLSELSSLNCDVAQGYLYARPLDSQAAYEFAEHNLAAGAKSG
ncbi:two-component system response regulator [Pseudoalteromonas rubra]|uniref:Two-component system response regulator n=1 Tax=Pseudoalteromonas rubra TaxID=43658 RepID=A0A5S3WPR4_9GAMM|nr:EAL domain-containing protein [Pseudoalteromonas rubra]TMP30359.1 two-component system response regulator [Pseudoalteromonas rubra]TMP35382.1 two-component system response regulator [Pseudoalteromonas rubra]